MKWDARQYDKRLKKAKRQEFDNRLCNRSARGRESDAIVAASPGGAVRRGTLWPHEATCHVQAHDREASTCRATPFSELLPCRLSLAEDGGSHLLCVFVFYTAIHMADANCMLGVWFLHSFELTSPTQAAHPKTGAPTDTA